MHTIRQAVLAAGVALGIAGAGVGSHPAWGQSGEATTLPPIIVEAADGGGGGAGGDPSVAVEGYVAEESATGTKTDTPLREIPQSVSVVTREQLDDRGADTLEEAINYSAGVAVSPYGYDTRFNQFIIRGFEQNTTGVYRDGLRLPTFGFTGFRIEPYGVDHIDILRGPTSVLYGLNNPGGLVNIVSKLPAEEAFGEVWASYGTHESKEVGFDVGGPANDSGSVLYRVTGLFRDADTQVDFVEDDRVYIAPAFTFRPSDATTLTILANYQKDDTGDTFQLLPAEAVLNGTISRGTFLGEPDFSHLKGEQWAVGYQFEHKFDAAWTVRQNLRYDRATTDYNTIYGSAGGGLISAPLIAREVQTADQSLDLFQVDNQLQFDSRFEHVENTFLLGLDYGHYRFQSEAGFAFVGNPSGTDLVSIAGFDPFNPGYGQFFFFLPQLDEDGNPIGITPVDTPPLYQDQTQTQETLGLYLQDQIKFDDRWVLTLGGRHDWVSSEVDNHLNPAASLSADDRAFTGRAGLGYLFDNGLTPYVGYATSFNPVAALGLSATGSALAPEEGMQYEAGIKYQPKGMKSFVTASVFDLTRENVTQANFSQGTPFYEQVGEVNVKGLELEGVLDLGNGWRFTGAYSYWQPEITADRNAAFVGNRPARIPEHLAAFWADYSFTDGPLAGLGLGAGIRYWGGTFGDNANIYEVPSYTLVDAAIRYEWDNWKLSLNVDNLFDEKYAATCASVGYAYCSYGEGRTATLRIGYRW